MRLFRYAPSVIFTLLLISSCSSETHAPGKPYHHLTGGQFRNPEGSTKRDHSFFNMAKFLVGRIPANFTTVNVPKNHVIPEKIAIQTLHALQGHDTITWLGHAAFLIHLNNKMILTDPYLTNYAGPMSFGPKRYAPPGISIANLPPINTILISHSHYDSLDTNTLKQLKNKDEIQAIIPLNMKQYFSKNGFNHVKELDWYQSVIQNDIRYTAIPAAHWSRRGLFDYNKVLWAGYVIHTKKHNILYMCDSAYHPTLFKKIGQQYGPFDYAIIDIAAYEPAAIMKHAHTTPEQAVQIGKDLHAKTIIAMHWGTVVLTQEPPFEPPVRFRKAATKAGFKKNNAWVMKIGETRKL